MRNPQAAHANAADLSASGTGSAASRRIFISGRSRTSTATMVPPTTSRASQPVSAERIRFECPTPYGPKGGVAV